MLGRLITAVAFISFSAPAIAQEVNLPSSAWAATCDEWDDWDKPAPPFRIHGDTYYVGTCGIAAILVKGESHHALIDAGTQNGASVVLGNLAALGINNADIGVLAASHEHHDHSGGLAQLQAATDAPVIASEILINVLTTGEPHPDDPQADIFEAMEPITHGLPPHWGEAPPLLDHVGLRPIATPGHTPGALTWQWESCEADGECLTIVYADSLSPVSADDYRFSDHPDYVQVYRESLETLAALDCDIFLSPHPSFGDLRNKILSGEMTGGVDCAEHSRRMTDRLDARLAEEMETAE